MAAPCPISESAVTIRTKTELLEIGVVVRDSRGHPVKDLDKDAFEVRDEGKARAIAYFSIEKFVPAEGPDGHTAATPLTERLPADARGNFLGSPPRDPSGAAWCWSSPGAGEGF